MTEERYTFPHTEAGVLLAFEQTLSLRAGGFRTRVLEHAIRGFPVVTLIAQPPARASRTERGCNVR